MKKHSKNAIQYKRGASLKKSEVLLRSISAILCLVFVLAACVGCTSYASSDEVATLNAELNDAIAELDSLKESYEAAQKEIDVLKSGGEEAQKELDALKTSNETAQQEITSLKTSNETAQQEIDALKGSNKAAQQEISTLKDGNKAAQDEIDTLKESNDSAKQEIDSLKSDNSTMRQEIDSLKSSNEDALQEIEKLKAQIQELENGTTPEEPVQKIKIYIDQGHNPTSYHNAGASGNGLYEQDLTYSIGILLAELLEEDGRFEVCLSRPTADTVLGTDNDSSLDARIKGAKDFGADYFISLHVNSYEAASANGIEVYVANQNSVSYDFGSALLKGLISSTNLYNRGMKLGPELRVLKNATMPAALLEMGFISNSSDAALLSQSPELFAQGIYNGILDYFDLPSNETPKN